MKELRVAMLGYGGIARSHKNAYDAIKKRGLPIKLVAICDINSGQFEKASETNLGVEEKTSFEGISLYTSDDEMLAKEDIDIVDICLPTYLHCQYTVKMLNAGKNVQCEKPMALNIEQCAEMLEAAKKSGKKLMIGQCLRFSKDYLFLKECIDSGIYGKVKYAEFERLSMLPAWSFENWFYKTELCGGCALDLHIHDVDMIRFLFGEPEAVSATACNDVLQWQYINSNFFYGDGKLVHATASFLEPALKPFKAGFRVRFDKAEILYEDWKITVYPIDGKPFEPEIEESDYMADEQITMARLVSEVGIENNSNPPESAMKSVELVKQLCKSADNGGKKVVFR